MVGTKQNKRPQFKITRRRKNKKPLMKAQRSAVSTIVERKLDAAVEDKFVVDASYTETISQWDSVNSMSLSDITPLIEQGDSKSERQGLRIAPKFLRLALRFIPQGYSSNTDSMLLNPPVTHSWLPPKTPCEIIVFRMAKLSAAEFPLTDIKHAINIKWRRKGVWKQDVLTDSIQDAIKALQVVHKSSLPALYTHLTLRTDDDSSGHAQSRSLVCPLASYKEIQFKLNNKFMLFENSTNMDANYRYYLCMRVADERIPTSYYSLANPFAADYRMCFVYEDA